MCASNASDLVLGLSIFIYTLQFSGPDANVAAMANLFGGEALMSDGAERRVARRFNMSLPLRIVACEASKNELQTRTRDLSYQGLYFVAEKPMKKGTEIDFVITLPQEITRNTDVNIRCRGQIVRVNKETEGQTGIAAKIEHYEFIPGNLTAA